MPRAAFLTAALLLAAGPAAAAESPLDLVRGLREAGLPALALEYLTEVEKGKPAADMHAVIPLERALVRLELAQQEEDEGARDAAVAQARAEFQAFLKANAKHPRAAEASLALARVTALEANIRLNRAGRLDGPQRTAAAAAVRPQFQQAAALFGQAAKQTEALLADPGLDPARKRELTRDAIQAELDRGINQLRMADTFDTADPKGVEERAKAIAAARGIFEDTWKRDANNPLCWVARAWAAACHFEIDERTKGEEQFKVIRTEAAKTPAGADGVRMVDFFEAQRKYLEAGAKAPPTVVRQAREQVKAWLDKDRYKARMTPERTSATFYYAVLSDQLARATGVALDKDGKLKDVTPAARGMLQEANAAFRRLTEFDNPYTDRAAAARTGVIRLLVGNADQPAEKFTDFEQAQMAALVQLSEAGQPKATPEARKERTEKAIRLLERCRHLAGPGVPAKEANEAVLQLAYAYLNADQPGQAAVLGEYLARHARPAGTAAKGGFIGVSGYLAAMARLGEDAPEAARLADRERAVELARFLDRTYPADPLTDAVRFRLGRLYFEERQYEPAFEVLSKIGPGYAGAAAARTIEGRAAYALIVGRDDPLPDARREQVFRKAVADAEAVPEPPPSAPADQARLYLGLRTLLAQLYIAHKDYAKAEQAAADAAKKAAAFTQLDATAKKAAAFAADEVRLRAVYAQAAPLYQGGKFKEAGDRLAPVLAEMAKGGPVNQGLEGEAAVAADALDRFRQDVITLALQAAIREGGGGAGELFDLLEKFGGSADALVRLVAQIRPQIDDLRREKKDAEADRLAGSVVGVLEKQAANPKLPPKTLARLGQALRGVGAHDKAVEVLTRVPEAKPEDLRKPLNQITEPAARDLVTAHQIARLELARAYRSAKQFDKAGEVLKEALGEEKNPGWARSLEYRKEAVLLLEDRAEAAPPAERQKAWGEAVAGWTRLVRDYQAVLTRPPKGAAKDSEEMRQWERTREKLLPVYWVLYADYQRCLARGNTQLVTDPAKRAEKLAKLGQGIFEQVEPQYEKAPHAEVKAAYTDLMQDFPPVREGYQKAGGKAFLPAAPPAGGG